MENDSIVRIFAFPLVRRCKICCGFATLGHGFDTGPPCLLVTLRPTGHYGEKPPKVRKGLALGAMDELIERLVADVGVDRATAEQAVAIIAAIPGLSQLV